MRIAGRVASAVAAAVAVVFVVAPVAQAAQTSASRPVADTAGPADVHARGWELANAVTGQSMWAYDPNVERPMGSITKVMTAYLVLEDGDLSRVITVPKGVYTYDNRYQASTAGLAEGEKLTARELLYALLIPSGCDAAFALATAYGDGNRDRFVTEMNAEAKKLGLTHTHFHDFSGLPVGGEYTTYSTPHDLIKLGLDAMRIPLFRQIVDLQSYYLPAGGGHHAHLWQTTNLLLKAYSGTIGIKTGSTDAAGECLLFEARRDGKTLIGVVLYASQYVQQAEVTDAVNMLNWGFKQPGALPRR